MQSINYLQTMRDIDLDPVTDGDYIAMIACTNRRIQTNVPYSVSNDQHNVQRHDTRSLHTYVNSCKTVRTQAVYVKDNQIHSIRDHLRVT